MRIIAALRVFLLALAGLIFIGVSFSLAASPTAPDFPKNAEPTANAAIEPAALQARAKAGWQARMQQEMGKLSESLGLPPGMGFPG